MAGKAKKGQGTEKGPVKDAGHTAGISADVTKLVRDIHARSLKDAKGRQKAQRELDEKLKKPGASYLFKVSQLSLNDSELIVWDVGPKYYFGQCSLLAVLLVLQELVWVGHYKDAQPSRLC